MEVHPVADLFPMLADDELAELAADIKQRGLLHPIVVDAEGLIIDGRNRLAACELAGVQPRFEAYDGDPVGYALASNGQRREMTKAQKAVVGARLISSSESELQDQEVAAALRIGKSHLSEAMVIARYPDLADRVLARVAPMPFSAALDEARTRDRRKAEEEKAKQRLQDEAPDLLSLVDEERMTLADAVAALEAREDKARREEREREQERQESLERDRERLRMVITGWPTMRNTILLDPDGDLAQEIITGLGETDQDALAKILAELTE